MALGTTALLSNQPVKRASTVITRGMCTVHVLSRDSWLEAYMKPEAEHAIC